MDRMAGSREHPPEAAAKGTLLEAPQKIVEGADSHHRCCRNRIVIPDRARPTLGAGGNPVTGGRLNRPDVGKRLTPAVGRPPRSILKLVKMDSNSFTLIIGTNGGNVK